MIKQTAAANPKMSLNRTSFRITGPVNQPSYTRMYKRAGAHRARLDSRIHRSAGDPIVTYCPCRFSKGDDLCMRRGIARSYYRIAAATYDDAVEDHHCSNWNLTVFSSCLGLSERFAH